MKTEILEVIKWYEKQFGRELTQLEKACVRNQCILHNQNIPNAKDLGKMGIRLSGLEYGVSKE